MEHHTMSYTEMVYYTFNLAEEYLYIWSTYIGISYEELNILLFVIIMPLYSLLITILLVKVYIDLWSLSLAYWHEP